MVAEERNAEIQGCVDRLNQGDKTAVDDLMAVANEPLGKMANQMLFDFPGVARRYRGSDIHHRVLLAFRRELERNYGPENPVEKFFGLARRIMRNHLHTLARNPGPVGLGRKDHSDGEAVMAGIAAADTTPSSRLARAEVRPFVRKLDREYREVLELRYYDDLSSAEIADRLGIPENTAKGRLVRARKKLRELLINNGYGVN